MTPNLVSNISKFKSSRHIYLYQEVYLAKEGFTQMSWVISLDVCAFKYFHQEVINNIINSIILQLALKISHFLYILLFILLQVEVLIRLSLIEQIIKVTNSI